MSVKGEIVLLSAFLFRRSVHQFVAHIVIFNLCAGLDTIRICMFASHHSLSQAPVGKINDETLYQYKS